MLSLNHPVSACTLLAFIVWKLACAFLLVKFAARLVARVVSLFCSGMKAVTPAAWKGEGGDQGKEEDLEVEEEEKEVVEEEEVDTTVEEEEEDHDEVEMESASTIDLEPWDFVRFLPSLSTIMEDGEEHTVEEEEPIIVDFLEDVDLLEVEEGVTDKQPTSTCALLAKDVDEHGNFGLPFDGVLLMEVDETWRFGSSIDEVLPMDVDETWSFVSSVDGVLPMDVDETWLDGVLPMNVDETWSFTSPVDVEPMDVDATWSVGSSADGVLPMDVDATWSFTSPVDVEAMDVDSLQEVRGCNKRAAAFEHEDDDILRPAKKARTLPHPRDSADSVIETGTEEIVVAALPGEAINAASADILEEDDEAAPVEEEVGHQAEAVVVEPASTTDSAIETATEEIVVAALPMETISAVSSDIHEEKDEVVAMEEALEHQVEAVEVLQEVRGCNKRAAAFEHEDDDILRPAKKARTLPHPRDSADSVIETGTEEIVVPALPAEAINAASADIHEEDDEAAQVEEVGHQAEAVVVEPASTTDSAIETAAEEIVVAALPMETISAVSSDIHEEEEEVVAVEEALEHQAEAVEVELASYIDLEPWAFERFLPSLPTISEVGDVDEVQEEESIDDFLVESEAELHSAVANVVEESVDLLEVEERGVTENPPLLRRSSRIANLPIVNYKESPFRPPKKKKSKLRRSGRLAKLVLVCYKA